MLTPDDAYNLLHQGILAFAKAEQRGICVDVEYCERKRDHIKRKISHLYKKLGETEFGRKWDGIYGGKTNFNSDYQLRHLLYKIYKFEPPGYTDKGNPKVDDDALTKLSYELPELKRFAQIRRQDKIKDVLEAFLREQVNGVLHPFFNLHTTETFRSSSDRINFQNIPKRDPEMKKICRRALLPPAGYQFLEVDYGALEVVIAACISRDETLLKYVSDPDSDMHGDMAHQIFMLDNYDDIMQEAGGLKKVDEFNTLRKASKNGFVFPQFYGDYYGNNAHSLACEWCELPKGRFQKGQGISMPDGGTVADHLIKNGIHKYSDFESHIEKIENHFWRERFPDYKKWRDNIWEEYQNKGYIDLPTGFRCQGIMRRNQLINIPIQGPAFHGLLWSFIQIEHESEKEKWKSKLIGQIHDALVMYLWPPEREKVVQRVKEISTLELKEAWDWIIAPLEVEAEISPVNSDWSETEEIVI